MSKKWFWCKIYGFIAQQRGNKFQALGVIYRVHLRQKMSSRNKPQINILQGNKMFLRKYADSNKSDRTLKNSCHSFMRLQKYIRVC